MLVTPASGDSPQRSKLGWRWPTLHAIPTFVFPCSPHSTLQAASSLLEKPTCFYPLPQCPLYPFRPQSPNCPCLYAGFTIAIEPLIYSIRGASLRGRMVRCPLSNSWEQAGHAKPAGQ
uniref:Uncharacterized protein n=1 Tax=Oryza nivara TaxID=4536 RepID=A0A0E0GD00_ORYNI